MRPHEPRRIGSRWRRVLVASVGLLAVFLLVRWGYFAHAGAVSPDTNDFGLIWNAARAVLEGRDPYRIQGFGYPYPATFYILVAPLGLLPVGAAVIVWHVAKCLVLALCLAGLWRMLRQASFRERVAAVALVAAALAVGRALDSDMRLGQTNLMILGLVVAVGYAWSRGRAGLAGLLLALATLGKVTPGLLLLYFAWKRRWRVVAFAAVGLVLFGVLAPVLTFGPGGTIRLYSEFGTRLVGPSLAEGAPRGEAGYVPGESLTAMVFRLLTASRATSPDGTHRGHSINVLSLEPATANLVEKGVAALLVVALLLSTRSRRGEAGSARRDLLELGLVVTIMLLAAPYARKAHFVHLLVPWTVLAASAVERRRAVTVVLLGVAFLLPPLTSRGLLGKDLSLRWTAYAPLGLAAVGLLVAALVELRALRREDARGDGSAGREIRPPA